MFLSHLADRIAFQQMDNDQRKIFVNTFVHESARHLQRNAEEILGAKDHKGRLIELLAMRNEDYNQYTANFGEPSYGMLRSFGHKVQEWMGNDQINRWAIDQVIQIDGPEAALTLKETIDSLFQSTREAKPQP